MTASVEILESAFLVGEAFIQFVNNMVVDLAALHYLQKKSLACLARKKVNHMPLPETGLLGPRFNLFRDPIGGKTPVPSSSLEPTGLVLQFKDPCIWVKHSWRSKVQHLELRL